MLAIFTVTPLDKGESVSEYVSRVVALVEDSGLDFKVTAMATIVEGEVDEVFDLIRECHKLMRTLSDRVSTHVAIDDRAGATGRIVGKVASIEEKLNRKVPS